MKAILYIVLTVLDSSPIIDKTVFPDIESCRAAAYQIDQQLVQGSLPFGGTIKEKSICVLRKVPKP